MAREKGRPRLTLTVYPPLSLLSVDKVMCKNEGYRPRVKENVGDGQHLELEPSPPGSALPYDLECSGEFRGSLRAISYSDLVRTNTSRRSPSQAKYTTCLRRGDQ